jgi:hypothetical protein
LLEGNVITKARAVTRVMFHDNDEAARMTDRGGDETFRHTSDANIMMNIFCVQHLDKYDL